MKTKFYELKHDNNRLIFRTLHFRAERTSVLHSGVYSKEFASMLLSGAICMVVYMVTEFMTNRYAILRYILLIIIFVISFTGGLKYIFKDRYLEAIFDRTNRSVTISYPGFFTKKVEEIPFTGIVSVEPGTKIYKPENIDGIDFVQKISLQHGSAVPGLGKEEEYIILKLKLADKSERILFAGNTDTEPVIPLKEIKTFLENSA